MRLTLIILAIMLPLVGCGQDPSVTPSGNIVKVGIIAPLSGSDFAKGKEGLRGVQTAMAMRPLLDNGDRVELVIKDDRNDPAIAVQALAELVQTDDVAAVVTFSGSGPALALAKQADVHRTPILAVLATHPAVPQHSDYVSQICFDNVFQGQVAAFFIRDELLMDRVAIFKTPDSDYSISLASEFQNQFSALGGVVTDVVEIRGQESNLAETMTQVMQKDPELLYMPLAALDVIAIMKTVAELNWNPREMASDGLLATVFSQYPEQIGLLDDLLATEFFHYSSKVTQFGQRARKVHQGKATSYTALGVEGFSILLEAMNRCGDPADRECIKRQIRSTTDFEGLLGKISIDSAGKAQRPVIINAIKNGRLEYIVKVY